jgi:hypothetical protein
MAVVPLWVRYRIPDCCGVWVEHVWLDEGLAIIFALARRAWFDEIATP